MKRLTVAGIAAALGLIVTAEAAFGVLAGVAPWAAKTDVERNTGDIGVLVATVDWLRLENYERLMERRRLTRKECADYRNIARRLNVPPKPC